MATRPRITLSIVSHGQGQLVSRLLQDLAAVSGAELVVTLNIPEDEAFLEHATGSPLIVVRNASPKGFGANHNAAFAHCRTPWFAVLNPDLRLSGDPFSALIEMASSLSNPGVVAPRIADTSGHSEDSVRTNPTPWSVAGRVFSRRIGRADPLGQAGFYWLAGMFLVFSSEAYRKIGGFDERFFLYYEDYDVCARLQRAGFTIAVAPQVTVVHDAQRSSRRSLRPLMWHLTSILRVWTSSVFWWALLSHRSPSTK